MSGSRSVRFDRLIGRCGVGSHGVAEGKTHMSDGVASSEVSGSRRTTSPR
jgi:hypothetical protein